jgi:hypothetical protein
MMSEHMENQMDDLIQSGINERDECYAEIDRLKRENTKAIQLLKMAVCPHCDGSGCIPETVIRTGHRQISETEFEPYPIEEVEPTQCQWCAERDLFINQKLKDENTH